MTKNHQQAFKRLQELGCPVFERDDEPETFFISAEESNSHEWADYYNEYARFPDFGVSSRVRFVLEPLGLFAEWENPGCLGVYEI